MTQENAACSAGDNKSKEKKCKAQFQQKVVVRRLPATMTQESFLEAVDPLPPHDYMYFVKADTSLGPHAFSRAYINFLNLDDILTFRDKFDGYVFVDSKGNEYPAVVEYAPCQKVPRRKPKKDTKCGTLEQDPDYAKFLDMLQNPEVVTLPSAESYLHEIEAKEKEVKVVTPLIEFIKQRKEEKRRLREEKREERRKRELEKKRIKDEERRRRRENKEREIRDRERERERTNSGSSRHSEKREDSTPVKVLRNPEREKDDKDVSLRRQDAEAKEYRHKRIDREREKRRREEERYRRDHERPRRDDDKYRSEEKQRDVDEKRKRDEIRNRREAERSRREEDRMKRLDEKYRQEEQKKKKTDDKVKKFEKFEDGRESPHSDSTEDKSGARDISASDSDSDRKDRKGDRSSLEEDKSEEKKDPRLVRRIRNKDRPSLQIYRPGMHRLRKTEDTPPLSSSSPSPTGSTSLKSTEQEPEFPESKRSEKDSSKSDDKEKKKSSKDSQEDKDKRRSERSQYHKDDTKSKEDDIQVRSMTFRRSISKEK